MSVEIDYIAHNNKFTNIDSKIKSITAISLILIALILSMPIVSIFVLLIAIFLTLFAGIPYKFYLKFLSVPLIFSLITFIFMAFFFGSGDILWNSGISFIVIRIDGLELAINTFLRIVACFSSLGFLALTTPITDILNILSKLRVPKLLLEIAMLMYTTIFLFFSQIEAMKNAQSTRLGYYGFKNSYRSLGVLISNLFFRSLDKSDKLQISLDSRGFSGSFHIYDR
ncbi:cobalt ECF transporter T component CbiQ [Methanobrevibacter curvatus]|uniref:Cobalt transport protein CbiQ n=1 Tax=Methanobrevibacter curvatus TaxID=49547 RepID=A0A166BCH7_9EURY|nr:cobalt ECF transporter T component CbiQ [Methanobrevibacter curvatus]KZX13149.1 cobalt transport protein CbiQ [Methanobrevibacter curvatus]